MRSPTCIFICMLGLLSSLSMAGQPVRSTVITPFTLSTGRFISTNGIFNVTLKFDKTVNAYTPILTKRPIRPLDAFKLKDGNLTTSDASLGAFFFESDFTAANNLVPIRFGKKVPVGVFVLTADFVVNTFFSPSAGLFDRLISLNGDIVARRLAEGEPLFVKFRGNTDSTEDVPLDVNTVRR